MSQRTITVRYLSGSRSISSVQDRGRLSLGDGRIVGPFDRQFCQVPSLLMPPSTFRPCSGVPSSADCNLVQPGSDEIGFRQRPGLESENKERHLERIFGFLLIAKLLKACAKDHRPMPRDQGAERRFGEFSASGHELIDELRVGESRDIAEVKKRPHRIHVWPLLLSTTRNAERDFQ
jgi:hypothetical protein